MRVDAYGKKFARHMRVSGHAVNLQGLAEQTSSSRMPFGLRDTGQSTCHSDGHIGLHGYISTAIHALIGASQPRSHSCCTSAECICSAAGFPPYVFSSHENAGGLPRSLGDLKDGPPELELEKLDFVDGWHRLTQQEARTVRCLPPR